VENIPTPVTTDNNPSEISAANPELYTSAWVWVHTDLLSGERVTAPVGEDFVLSFDGNGMVSSFTDCNSLSGIYTVDGEVLSMGQFVSTLMYCEASMEGVYVEQLGLVNSYVIEGDTMRLNLDRDYGVMTFIRSNE
jgi:heat shock protein HslJ